MSHGRKGERSITGCSDFQAQSLSLRMPVVAKRDEAHVLAVASNTSCQTRGELVFNLAAAKRDKPQPTLVTGNACARTHKRTFQTWEACSSQQTASLQQDFNTACRSCLARL